VTADASLGQLIREKRERLGLTQETLAELVDVTQTAVSGWESDAFRPGIDSLKRLAKVLKVATSTLLAAA
jgi:transcriptional regulator with XRE-family HTH domain